MARASICPALASVLLALLATTAQADWIEASSDHFVIYSDQSEKSLRPFAERLELFHAAMTQVLRREQTKPSPSNRVTIYVVSSDYEVRRLAQTNNKYMAGVYKPRAGATVALIPQLRTATLKLGMSPETILYHEYAHHFMAGMTARAYPRWFVEGFAEFFSGVRFRKDNVDLGMPANHRAYELTAATHVPIRTLLSFDGGASEPKRRYDAFYGESWALFHCLQFAPERSGQLGRYQALLAQGQTALEAAEGAFGDLDQLERDVRAYWKRGVMSYVVLDRHAMKIGPINFSTLSPGAAEMMTIAIQAKTGLDEEEAVALLPEARKIAGRHPEDADVLAVLAAVEVAAGNYDAAIATADRAVALDPQQIDASLQKGFALFNKAETGPATDADWQAVRNQFARANRIENDHPIPLIQFYVSYRVQGSKPTPNAVDGLAWAMEIAPFDSSVRWMLTQELISDHRLAEAAQTLAPLAYSPHRNEFTERALRMLTELEARIEGGQGAAAVAESDSRP